MESIRAKLKEHEENFVDFHRTLCEISATLKQLEHAHESIAYLIEAKVEHTVEIKHLNSNLNRVYSELQMFNSRMSKLEAVKEEESRSKRFAASFVEIMREYWHVIAIFASIISFVLSYFFGFKVKGDA